MESTPNIDTPTAVEQVKQEIQSFIERQPLTVTNKDESVLAQAAITAGRSEYKYKKDFLTNMMLVEPEKTFKQAKAGFDSQKAKVANILQPLTDWETKTNKNILAFETVQRERDRKAQEKANDRHKSNVQKAIAKGKDPETVPPPMIVAPQSKTVKSEAGGYTLKVNKKLDIFAEALIPNEYRVVDEKKVEAALRGGGRRARRHAA